MTPKDQKENRDMTAHMKAVFVLMDIAGLKGIIGMAYGFLDFAERSKSTGSFLRTGKNGLDSIYSIYPFDNPCYLWSL